MRAHQTMSPCERVRYYRARLCALQAGAREADCLLARALEQLLSESLRECRENAVEPGRAGER